MRAFLLVVEMRVLDEQLPHRVAMRDIAAVFADQNRLPLRSIVRLDLLRVAGQLTAVAADVVEPTDLRCTARDPDHAWAQLAAEPRDDVVVDVAVLFADERHGADLADEFIVKFGHGKRLPAGERPPQDCTRYALMKGSSAPSITA